MLDKEQSEAVAKALLLPSLQAQVEARTRKEELRRKRVASVQGAVKVAPLVIAASLAVVVATILFKGIFVPGLIAGPFVGLLVFFGVAAYWRTGKNWLLATYLLLFFLGKHSAEAGGITWGMSQSLANAILIQFVLVLIFGKRLVSWVTGSEA